VKGYVRVATSIAELKEKVTKEQFLEMEGTNLINSVQIGQLFFPQK
jgi:hypothetical protein